MQSIMKERSTDSFQITIHLTTDIDLGQRSGAGGGREEGRVQWSISGNLNPFQPNGKTKHSPKPSALNLSDLPKALLDLYTDILNSKEKNTIIFPHKVKYLNQKRSIFHCIMQCSANKHDRWDRGRTEKAPGVIPGPKKLQLFSFGYRLEDVLPPILSMSSSTTQSILSPVILETN